MPPAQKVYHVCTTPEEVFAIPEGEVVQAEIWDYNEDLDYPFAVVEEPIKFHNLAKGIEGAEFTTPTALNWYFADDWVAVPDYGLFIDDSEHALRISRISIVTDTVTDAQ